MTGTENPHPVAKPLAAAGVLFLDRDGRVMLVRPTYKPYWDIPGGYLEPGESPRSACEREIFEELGIRARVGGLLAVDWAPHPDEGDKLLFIFDGGSLTDEQLGAVGFRDGEVAEYTFAAPADIHQLSVPRLARRLHATLSAHAQRRPAYLENGTPPTQNSAS